MVYEYFPVLILMVLAVVSPIGMVALTSLLGPKVKSKVKGEAYECGVPAVGSARDEVSIHFHKIAILFLLFDVEAALLFPWAVLAKQKLGEWGAAFLVGELAVFLIVLVVGYAYAWKSGALEWE